ncbi:DJ-1/PfpI family protein [Pseudonocardia sp. ICBG1034]|uniref:DJ-1/PfpI family protein n=1 Tax=Pseudonocardia sp. ICBG1034 TaxID=2844381 RepID=UPI001CCFEBE1|nr:DJ-1/PfpI family protein [Pseudonocardia sp. ICBG1034]
MFVGAGEGSVRDVRGLRVLPDRAIAEPARFDVLHVPGGSGQEALMEDQEVLTWLRDQASVAGAVLPVCTGALLLGAAGLLQGRRATTHWSARHLLPSFGAVRDDRRVVVDDTWVFAGGVTAGIDGALRLAAELRGRQGAEVIQLGMQYDPEPPFDAGPDTAPPEVLARGRKAQGDLTARRVAERLGVRPVPAAVGPFGTGG